MNQRISERARMIFDLSGQLLREDESDDIQGEAYRYSYLVLRGPKMFKETFEESSLYLDQRKIRDAFWSWRFDLPGNRGLTEVEIELIEFHNEQVGQLRPKLYLKERYD